MASLASHRHCWLLRARRERPGCRRAAEQRDELAPFCMTGKEHCEGGWVMTAPPWRPEARSLFGPESASELGAPVASSIPEQLPGHEPASARKGYEDG